MTMPLLLASCLAAATPALPAPQDGAAGFRLELPPGPAARAWAGVGPDTLPADLSPAMTKLIERAEASARDGETAPSRAPGLWSEAAAWELWASRVAFVAARPEPSTAAALGAPQDTELAAARADLALLAAAQGRSAHAWSHFARLTDSPAHAARVAPCLMPGVPLSAPVGPGGAPRPLRDGVLLHPITPEYPADDPSADLAWRSAQVTGLAVGDSALSAGLSVESSGVELVFELTGGPPVEVRGLLPEPQDYAIRFEYLDWTKVEHMRSPATVRLVPGDEEPHVLYGRVQEAQDPWPGGRPGHLAASLQDGGLWLVLPASDPEHARWAAAAQACGELLGVPAGTREPAAPAASAPPGLELSVPRSEHVGTGNRRAFARYLAASLEAHLGLH